MWSKHPLLTGRTHRKHSDSNKVQFSDSLFSYFSIYLRKTRRCLREEANTESLIQAKYIFFRGRKFLVGGINKINSHFGVFLFFLLLLLLLKIFCH
jgi:hypothetical protein